MKHSRPFTTSPPTVADTPRGFQLASIADAEFLSLPRPGARCPFSGLSRTGLIELMDRGVVAGVNLRRPGTTRGKRLIVKKSLSDYLHGLATGKPVDPSSSAPGADVPSATAPIPDRSTQAATPGAGGSQPVPPTELPLDEARADAIRRDPPKYLSVGETAAYLSTSPQKIREHIAAGLLTYVKLGDSVLLRTADIDRDLERFVVRPLP